MGWELDYRKFRVYLREKYAVIKAYLFIGYVPTNERMYLRLKDYGYILVFKPILLSPDGKIKGNVDADLVLRAMRDYKNNAFDQAVIVTSDGDFYCLVEYFYQKGKLRTVLSPYVRTCSTLLKKTAKEKIVYMDNLRLKLSYIRKRTA